MPTRVYLESGLKRTFAGAVDWPGWTRAAPRRAVMSDDVAEAAALEALTGYLERYLKVLAGLDRAVIGALPTPGDIEVLQRIPGDASTDFGAPGRVPDADREPLTDDQGARLAALITGCWDHLDRVAASAPAALRKGPRGGGRDRDAVVAHVVDAEASYLRRMGLPGGAATSLEERRSGLLDALHGRRAVAERTWPLRYGVRRAAWHVLDHAWEIEDRSE